MPLSLPVRALCRSSAPGSHPPRILDLRCPTSPSPRRSGPVPGRPRCCVVTPQDSRGLGQRTVGGVSGRGVGRTYYVLMVSLDAPSTHREGPEGSWVVPWGVRPPEGNHPCGCVCHLGVWCIPDTCNWTRVSSRSAVHPVTRNRARVSSRNAPRHPQPDARVTPECSAPGHLQLDTHLILRTMCLGGGSTGVSGTSGLWVVPRYRSGPTTPTSTPHPPTCTPNPHFHAHPRRAAGGRTGGGRPTSGPGAPRSSGPGAVEPVGPRAGTDLARWLLS